MSGNVLFIHVNEWAGVDSPDAIPVSCGYILARLKQHGFCGHILGDYQGSPLAPRTLASAIRTLQPLALGFSVYEENINRVRTLARFAKHLRRDLLVVLGGPQITFMPGEALHQMAEADILCRGEGEIVMLDLARALAAGDNLDLVPGISFVRDGRVVDTPVRQAPDDLDEYPSPYLTRTIDPAGKQRAILLTSRGCASPCTFCYTPRASGRKVRFHSIGRIIEEMIFLRAGGINDFWFADPNFAHSRERLAELLTAIREQVPGAGFWCQTRANLVDDELLRLLQGAGAHTIAFGLESAHPATLQKIKKGLDPSRTAEAVRLAREAGLRVELFTQFGLPGDTVASSRETLRYVKDNGVRIAGNSISQQMHLFFGAPVADDPGRHGIIPHRQTRPSYLSICRDYHTDAMSEEDIRLMSLLWRLNRADFQEDAANGRNLFTIAGFINGNRKLLNGCPDADILLAKIYSALDEPKAAAVCLKRLREHAPHNPEVQQFLAQPLVSFRSKRRARAARGCRIIFDCTGTMDGREIPETLCRYHMATLGRGCLVPDFEKGIDGVKAGSATQFAVRFPDDYGNRDLAGQKAVFRVYLHQVLEPVLHGSVDELHENARRNMYRFDDLFGLKTHNENLYYMVLRDSVLHNYTGNLTDSIALFSYYLKLGFKDQAMEIAWSLPDEPTTIGHIGKILQVNNHAGEALDFLGRVAGTSGELENQRIKAWVQLKEYGQAEELASHPLLATNLETMALSVRLASLLQLPLAEFLRRMDRLLDTQVKMMAAELA
ncbi:MAG: radical SAM protein [Desulfobulbus sp.]|nr:MAG: radical SAM protein [Desulfobulbus sp.]